MVFLVSTARPSHTIDVGGDDTTVRFWGLDQSNVDQEYPFTCRATIQTGHRANIFNVAQLPHSTRIATVAGDKEVRVFDTEVVLSDSAAGTDYAVRSSTIRVLRCHGDRVKRLVTEDSPDVFLSVAEDGTVRQHDLRSHHVCGQGTCPAPLVKVNHELSTISLSPLTPYQFVVAGDSPYGYLFDRRHVGRFFSEEWGAVPRAGDDLTTCVRRFGRPAKTGGQRHLLRDHITGVRVSPQNGHEILLTYSSDAVYLYSANDEPKGTDSASRTPSPILTPNTKQRRAGGDQDVGNIDWPAMSSEGSDDAPDPALRSEIDTPQGQPPDDEGDEGLETSILLEDPSSPNDLDFLPDVPVVLPRRRYFGAQNVATTKDVNFLGPNDELVVSGSDDGNFFLWDKKTETLQGIYEGDGSIVNVIEGHPYLPVIAVSGIDTTVKVSDPVTCLSQAHNAKLTVLSFLHLQGVQVHSQRYTTRIASSHGTPA
ncbi:hypothetical protein AX17_001339 [Amanita inopinata Kibby_2008]|nr:hypothetical protein AX17_001339 [Amanita inopinata Kibby_2008]